MEVFDTNKTKVLIALYHEIFAELRRYRDMEYKVVSWTVLLLGGIIGATRIAPIQANHKVPIQTLLLVVTVLVAIYGGWHIHYLHARLTWYRQLRRKIDRIFRFHDKNVYCSDSILPHIWKDEATDITYFEGIRHLIQWWGLIALTTLYAIYSIIFMGTS